MPLNEMKCNEVRESLLELASGTAASAEVESHLLSCGDCSAELAEFRQTMAMLDEWQVPEPSPYFDTRLMARMREEKTLASTRRGWLGWMWKPVMGAAMATALFVGVSTYRQSQPTPAEHAAVTTPAAVQAERGTAVADLQALDIDESQPNYADFEVLDELQPEGAQSSNAAQ